MYPTSSASTCQLSAQDQRAMRRAIDNLDGISLATRSVYRAAIRIAFKTGRLFATQKFISKRAHVCVKTVGRALKVLVGLRLLEKQSRGNYTLVPADKMSFPTQASVQNSGLNVPSKPTKCPLAYKEVDPKKIKILSAKEMVAEIDRLTAEIETYETELPPRDFTRPMAFVESALRGRIEVLMLERSRLNDDAHRIYGPV